MVSQWYYKQNNCEVGPVTFAELVTLVRQGTVTETSAVRRKESYRWLHAWTVPALFASAGQPGPDTRASVPETSTDSCVASASDNRLVAPSRAAACREPDARVAHVRHGAVWTWLLPFVAAGIGGFLLRYVSWRHFMRFPPPHEASGGDECYMILIGRCSYVECGLLYLDVSVAVAAITWYVCRRVEQWGSTL